MSWLIPLMPHVKALHIGFLMLWIAGLLAMPRMLAKHDHGTRRIDYSRIRHATHFGYIWGLTPAAVLAIMTGGLLIFLREVFTVWLFAKLVLVAVLVGMHGWVGYTINAVAETEGTYEPPDALIHTAIICTLVVGILILVLAKPDLGGLPVPDWLTTPRGRQLPFDMPSR